MLKIQSKFYIFTTTFELKEKKEKGIFKLTKFYVFTTTFELKKKKYIFLSYKKL